MTVAPAFLNSPSGSPNSSNSFYHPRRSNNSLNQDIEHVMRLMAGASLPIQQAAGSGFVDLNNNTTGQDKWQAGSWSSSRQSSFGSQSGVPTDQCLYIQIPKSGGLF